MKDIPDFDTVPESFYTVSWWNKPNPFPEDMDEGKRRRQYLRDYQEIHESLTQVSLEGFRGGEKDHKADYAAWMKANSTVQ